MSARRISFVAAVVAAASAFGAAGARAAAYPAVEAAARRGVIIELHKAGVYLRHRDIAVRCRRTTTSGGAAARWLCRVNANGGQCTGTVAVLRTRGKLLVREFGVACRE